MDHDVLVTILSALLLFSEALGGIKRVGENSIYQLILRVLKVIAQIFTGTKKQVAAV